MNGLRKYDRIPGPQDANGYYMMPRLSIVDEASLPARDIWRYFMSAARYADGDGLRRGQLRTSYKEILEGTSCKNGFGADRYTRDQCKRAIAYLKKCRLIKTIVKSKRLIVTIINYTAFQDSSLYNSIPAPVAATNNGLTRHLRGPIKQNDNKALNCEEEARQLFTEAMTAPVAAINENPTIYIEIKEKNNNTANFVDNDNFKNFWDRYPNKKDKNQALTAWNNAKKAGVLPEISVILESIDLQDKDRQELADKERWFPDWKYPAKWIESQGWHDRPAKKYEKKANEPYHPPYVIPPPPPPGYKERTYPTAKELKVMELKGERKRERARRNG